MISIGIATLKEREYNFRKVIESVYHQADRIVAVLNYYEERPQWIKSLDKVETILMDNEYGDSGKFLTVDFNHGYYFSIDDDILYPPNYIKDTIKAIDHHKCICTYHGKIFANRPIASYHRSFTKAIRCIGSLDRDTFVDIGGSGVMGFNTKDFKLDFNGFKEKNMSDIWVSQQAHAQGVKILALAHKSNYFQYLGTEGKTIWETRRGNTYETTLVNSFLK